MTTTTGFSHHCNSCPRCCRFTWRADARRRRLNLGHLSGRHFLFFLDVACVSIYVGAAVALLVLSPHSFQSETFFTPATLGAVACVAILLFLWSEGKHQVQLQRPAGIVFAEGAILLGLYRVVPRSSFTVFSASPSGQQSLSPFLVVLSC